MEQKREWSLQLKRVILENYSAAIPAHARQLVMELGQGSPLPAGSQHAHEGGGASSRASSRSKHSAPQYLERRQVRSTQLPEAR